MRLEKTHGNFLNVKKHTPDDKACKETHTGISIVEDAWTDWSKKTNTQYKHARTTITQHKRQVFLM